MNACHKLRHRVTIMVLVALMVIAHASLTFAAKPKMSRTKATITVGSRISLKVKNAKGKKVKWKSSNSKVAKVSKSGTVRGVKPGKATVKAFVGSKKLSCKITVKKQSDLIVGGSYSKTYHAVGGGVITIDTSKYNSRVVAAIDKMLSLSSKYPHNSAYTDRDYYDWRGGVYAGGFGCCGFAFILSDSVFGDAPARRKKTLVSLLPTDIIRYDAHAVIVLDVCPSYVVVAEGNYDGRVKWGRKLEYSEIREGFVEVITRW